MKLDKRLCNRARNTLTKEIRVAKRSYTKRLENRFSANIPRSVWINHLTTMWRIRTQDWLWEGESSLPDTGKHQT